MAITPDTHDQILPLAKNSGPKPYDVYGPDVGDFFELLKPRVMSLVVFTALTGLLLAPGGMHPVLAFTTILSIALGAGASGALNMWYDSDIDLIMSRTANRPIPAGRIRRDHALGFGLFLSVVAVALLCSVSNLLAAALLAFTIFFYAVIYSVWLKRHTPQNIVIGGAAGAFPPMIGWVAVTGSISLESVFLFAIIFLWTPPHFWALALYKSADYEAAKVPMMPNVVGVKSTKLQIFVYALILFVATMAPMLFGMVSWAYAATSISLGLIFVAATWRLMMTKDERKERSVARGVFAYSILYLFVLYLVLIGDHLLLAPFAPLISWGV